MQKRNLLARVLVAAAAMVAGAGATTAAPARKSALPYDVQAGVSHDPQMGRYAYRGGPGTKAVKRAAAKRRNVIKHRARA